MKKSSLLFLAALFLMAGCQSAKEKMGFTKSAPDEFMVMSRAPLEMPPDYTLRPPVPGAERPQDFGARNDLRQTVLGEREKSAQENLSSGENYLLQQTGGSSANEDIRNVVDIETAKLAPKKKSVAEKLIGYGKPQQPEASVVDPVKETERLKQNKEEGKPVTDGKTPAKTE